MVTVRTAKKIGYYVIALAFLVYGILRLNGAVPAVGQAMEWSDTEMGRTVLAAARPGFAEMEPRGIVPLSLTGYMMVSLLMGITLSIGSFLALFKIRAGYYFMGLFFLLFAFGFVNYQVFNSKIIHFAISLALFILMLWLSDYAQGDTKPTNGDNPNTVSAP